MLLSLVCAAAKEYGPKVQRLKRICRAATIAIPPSVYVRVTSEQDVITRLKDVLSKHGLAKDSSPEEIAQVKRTLKKERDLDGMRFMPEEMLPQQQHDIAGRHSALSPEAFWLHAPADDVAQPGMTMRFIDQCGRWDSCLFCNAGIDTGNIVESSRSRRPCVIPHAYVAVAASGSDEEDDKVTFRTSVSQISAARVMSASIYIVEVRHEEGFLLRAQAGLRVWCRMRWGMRMRSLAMAKILLQVCPL